LLYVVRVVMVFDLNGGVARFWTLLLSRQIASLLCSPLLPNSNGSEHGEEENETGNHRWLDTERKNVSRHLRLEVDVDGCAHLNNKHRRGGQENLMLVFGCERPQKPWQQEQNPGDHFSQFARENRLVGQMALFNLSVEPATDWLEEFEESESEHQDSQEQGQGLDDALELACGGLHMV
jgi:hypothetical protein